MRSITEIVGRFKQNWTRELSSAAIAQACRDAGMAWHNSVLNPIVTIQVFFSANLAWQHGLRASLPSRRPLREIESFYLRRLVRLRVVVTV